MALLTNNVVIVLVLPAMFRGRSGLAGLAARSNNPEDRREGDSDNNTRGVGQPDATQPAHFDGTHCQPQCHSWIFPSRGGGRNSSWSKRDGLPPSPAPLTIPHQDHHPPDPWGDGCGDGGSLSPASRLSSLKRRGRGGLVPQSGTFATNHRRCLVFTSDCPSWISTTV